MNFLSSKDKQGQGEKDAAEAPPLQLSVVRNLSDKLYEKRKQGALDLEQLIRDLLNAKEDEKIKSVIQYVVTTFSDSPQGNYKKGGLIALAAVSIGLGAVNDKV
jgi:vacuole morphology and inheritance protein 14